MISIAQPAMVLNADNVPGPDYRMWNTYKVPPTHDEVHILNWIQTVATGAPGGKLKGLVFNSHGSPASLSIGTGIARKHTALFSSLAGLVDDIYIVACKVALISAAGDGNLFCCEIAKNAKANVYASTASQTTGLWPYMPYGEIDGFEGEVYKWDSSGSCVLTSL